MLLHSLLPWELEKPVATRYTPNYKISGGDRPHACINQHTILTRFHSGDPAATAVLQNSGRFWRRKRKQTSLARREWNAACTFQQLTASVRALAPASASVARESRHRPVFCFDEERACASSARRRRQVHGVS
jgi:hypothetical protein